MADDKGIYLPKWIFVLIVMGLVTVGGFFFTGHTTQANKVAKLEAQIAALERENVNLRENMRTHHWAPPAEEP